jgi:hypothetical protein
MEKIEPTNKHLSSVSCPTCGVGAGEPCVWNSAGTGFGPHLNRKLSALDGIERDKPIDNSRPVGSPDDAVRLAPKPVPPLR